MMVWSGYDDDEGCVTDDVNVGGYFYMAAYEPAFMRVIPRPVDQVLKVSNCSQVEITLNGTSTVAYTYLDDQLESAIGPNQLFGRREVQ